MTSHNLSFEAIMEMSPEELAKLDPTQLANIDAGADDSNDNTSTDTDVQNQEQDTDEEDGHESGKQSEHDEDDQSDEDGNDADDQEEENNSNPHSDQGNQAQDQEGDDTDTSNDDADPKSKEEKKAEQDTAIPQEEAVKYKTFFDSVTAEFRANGTTFKIQDPNDIISLMQKGLNYNQKMAAIKPYFGLIETLKEHGLTDAGSLGFLIDLKNKKPEAIAKLVQESGVDTYDLNEDKAKAYTPTEVDLSPQRAEITAIEQDYANDADFDVVLGEVRNWDQGSRNYIYQNPVTIRMLMDHKKSGLFDQIIPNVKQALAVGKVQGSFLEIYDQVGRAMFAQQQQQQGEAQAQQAAVPVQTPNPTQQALNTQKQDQQRLAAAKKAASMTPKQKQAVESSKPNITEDDIFNMSAEELAKINPKFLKGK